ncbi:MAG: hypothetical protein AAF705_09005 [Bacteroidota bacterium]
MRLPILNWILFLSLSLSSNFGTSGPNKVEFHAVFGNIVVNKSVKNKDSLLSEKEGLPWYKMMEAGIIVDSENYLKFKFIMEDDRSNLYSLTQNKKGNKLSIEYLGKGEMVKSILLTYY